MDAMHGSDPQEGQRLLSEVRKLIFSGFLLRILVHSKGFYMRCSYNTEEYMISY